MLSRRQMINAGGGITVGMAASSMGYGTVFGQGASPVASPAASPGTAAGTMGRTILREAGPVGTSYLSPLVEIYGDVEIGERSFVASNTILFAGDGRLVSLGNENNLQDNAYILAEETDLTFADMVSIAHQAVIEDSNIGAFTFFGFRSRTRNAVVEEGAMVMHNTVVENVTIPANRITPIGVRITTQEQADALPEIVEANEEFKREVQGVNLEFADGYIALFEDLGRGGLEAVGPNPTTSWQPDRIMPRIEDGTVLAELVRVVGDVRLGEDSTVGQRSALRADEGTPIIIGRRARIQSRVTFHALKGTSVTVGDNAQIGDGNVVHGPLVVGDNFVSEDDCVVFRAIIEDNVTMRTGSTVAGDLTLREGTIVPEGAVVTTQDEADALPIR
jgi:carbonic anhydrase/acetyltransferase-like protein (isoleucine patch superfamily)